MPSSSNTVLVKDEWMSNIVTDKIFCLFIKGIAITLMIIHHSFGFPNFYISDISYPSILPISACLADATKICVALFAFLTGVAYGLHKDRSYKYSLKKIIDFLLDFWVVCFVFIILATACGYHPTVEDVLLEMLGLKTYVMIFCWYVSFYIELMLVLPLYARIIKLSGNIKTVLLASIVFYLLIRVLGKYFQKYDRFMVLTNFEIWFPIVISGFLLTRYNVLNLIYNKIIVRRFMPYVFGVLLIVSCFALQINKVYFKGSIIGVITAPMLILGISLVGIYRVKFIKNIFVLLGYYSMNIWFLHCLFFSDATKDIFQKFVYVVRIPVLVVCWILLLCTVLSIPIHIVQKKFNVCVNRLILKS